MLPLQDAVEGFIHNESKLKGADTTGIFETVPSLNFYFYFNDSAVNNRDANRYTYSNMFPTYLILNGVEIFVIIK